MNYLFNILIALSFITTLLPAQQLERYTLDLAGGLAISQNFQLHYSLGEQFKGTSASNNLILGQGFIQGLSIAQSTPILETGFLPRLNVHPNPTSDFIQVDTKENAPGSTINLIGLDGKLLLSGDFKQQLKLDLQQQASGIYFLQWRSSKGTILQEVKVVKQ